MMLTAEILVPPAALLALVCVALTLYYMTGHR